MRWHSTAAVVAASAIFNVTNPYSEFLAELEEIERYKWLVSEQQGVDVGLERALNEWARQHRAVWRHQRNEMLMGLGDPDC